MEKLYLVGFFIASLLFSLINLFLSPFYLPEFLLRFNGKREPDLITRLIKLAFNNHFYLKRN